TMREKLFEPWRKQMGNTACARALGGGRDRIEEDVAQERCDRWLTSVGASPKMNSREEIKRDEPERPNIRRRSNDTAIGLFGGHPQRRSHRLRALRSLRIGDELCDSEVERLHFDLHSRAHRLSEKNILWFEIAVNDSDVMRGDDRVTELLEDR